MILKSIEDIFSDDSKSMEDVLSGVEDMLLQVDIGKSCITIRTWSIILKIADILQVL